MTGELSELESHLCHPPITVAVHPSTSDWTEGFEKISSHQKSAARHALEINKHCMLVFESIASISRIVTAVDGCVS